MQCLDENTHSIFKISKLCSLIWYIQLLPSPYSSLYWFHTTQKKVVRILPYFANLGLNKKTRLNWAYNLINCETYSKLESKFCYLLRNIAINIFKNHRQHNIIQSYNNLCHDKAISFITIQHNFSTFHFNATILF